MFLMAKIIESGDNESINYSYNKEEGSFIVAICSSIGVLRHVACLFR